MNKENLKNPATRNERYFDLISNSPFGSISRLAEHLDIHYRNIDSYGLLERDPIDKAGYVKYDIAAIAKALNCELEALFPDGYISCPYRYHPDYEESGYGRRAKKTLGKKRRKTHTELTPDILATLRAYRDQGILPHQIFENATAVPGKLNGRMVSGWLFGRRANVPTEQLTFVLARCVEMRGDPVRRIAFSSDMRKALEAHRERSGVSATELLRLEDDVPAGLSAATISRWINNPPAKVRNDHYEFVLGAWEHLGRGE